MELDKIATFLNGIGFHVTRSVKPQRTVIPGVFIDGMTVYVDPNALVSPGDILHDVGHQAIVPSLFREQLNGDLEAALQPLRHDYFESHSFTLNDIGTEDPIYRALLQTGEAEAQAWSYAAAIAADIAPELVFHSAAYEGESETVLLMMQINSHFGIHGLQAAKMTTVLTFPKMLRWLQQ